MTKLSSIQEEDLDSQQGVIDFSLYLRRYSCKPSFDIHFLRVNIENLEEHFNHNPCLQIEK